MHAGACYLKPSGPDNKLHLYVVLVDPNCHGIMLWVPVCSVRTDIYYDSSCLLEEGDHDFIKTASYVAYNFADRVHANHLEKMVRLNAYRLKPDASARVLQAILTGLASTDEVPKGIKQSYHAWPDEN